MSAHWSSRRTASNDLHSECPPFHLLPIGGVSFFRREARKHPDTEHFGGLHLVDPPFGANIMYSELNSLWKRWLKVLTDVKARQSRTSRKERRLMTIALDVEVFQRGRIGC